ncbi:unnamed protein product [Cladocopium goreaui]|uniref:RNase H type-1 domain-containing protein n=1 Tax=Cladocopium goreaui TaxID=2562237 RepID=A0A9P1C1B3_9DINO|nr:unnamed protein product [Cladocopium goreaui]
MRVLEDEETTTSIMPITAPEDILEDPVAIDRFPAEQEDLVTSWRSAASISTAIITEDGETKVKFVTWFLNGDRWPRCDAYRVVALPADLERWEALFRQRWHDRVDPAAQLHVSLVYPPVTPDNHGGHLILHQGLGPTVRGTLISVFWHGQDSELSNRFAQVVPHWLSFQRPTETAVNRSNRAPVLLQLSNLLQREVLSQEESADEPSLTASTTVAIRLRSGCDSILVPEYIECSAPGDSTDIEAELTHWGIACKAVRFGPRHEALCLPVQWIASANQFHYMFCHDDPKDDEGTFLHTSEVALDDLGLMQLLYKLGYCRAAILDTEEPMPQFFRIIFRDVVQQHAVKPEKHKAPSPWPAPLCCNRENRPFFTPKGHIEGKDDFLLRFGITMTDIHAFFASGTDVLCRDPAGLDLPESTMQAMHMSETTNLASFDRLIIYTDGSSLPLHRHRPAAWNEEKGLGDTWAFVVLGERSLQQPPVIEIIGWLTHPRDGLPSWSAAGFHVPPPLLPSLHATSDSKEDKPNFDQCAQINISLASANIGSMYNGEWGHAGKLDYLRTQFKLLHLNFLGLQEARTPELCSRAQKILRFASGPLMDAYAMMSKGPAFFEAHHFVVVHKDPRCLLLHVVTEWVDFWLVVGHAPQSGVPLSERAEWWEQLNKITALCPPTARLFALLDANAGPGQADHTSVFNTIGSTTSGTPLLRAFLEDRELCLPCTSTCHEGPHTTWVTPDGMSEHLIDYIAIPKACLQECLLSKVLDEFDLGNSHHDHMAIALQLQWKETGPSTSIMKRSSKATIDFGQLQGAHVMQDTWNLRTQKLIARRGLRQIARRHRQELLRACFQSWATTSDYDIEGFWTYRRWLLCANVKLMARFHTSAAHLKKKLRDRKTAYLKQVFADLPPDAPASSILHALKKVVGSTNLKQIKQQTLPYVKDSSGQHCTSPSQALDTWIQFFQNMEGGRRVNRQEQRQLWIKNLQAFQATSLDLMITDVPSLVELEAAFRHVKPNKATGPDLIDANVCASSPAIVARKTYSQLLKLYTHGQESLLHKGGRLQPIWKQKGPRDACSAYRSVLISSHIGKSLHRCLRLHSADVFEHYLQLQQTGGMRGISVTMGVHQARSYLRTRLRQRKCVGLLFLDLTEAFYRIVRQLALGGPPDDAAIVAVGDRLQLGPDLLHALHQHLEDQSAVERAGLSPQLQKMMSDNGILDSFPAEDGLRLPATDVSECGTQSFLGPTWMDDTCIAFATDSAVTLEQAAGRVGGSLLGLCAEFAMSPNLAKGKTELMMVFQGKGATQAKLKYFGPSSPQTFPIILEDGIQHLSVVSSYTHLGSTIHHRGDLRREVRRRLGLAHAAFNRHRKLLFQNRGLDLCRRRELFRTLILSKLLYGAESWTLRDGKDKHYLHSALMRLYNRLLPVQQHPPRSDAAILADTGLPDPAVLLRVCRLRHLGQLYGNGHRTSWGLFNDDLEWQELIWCDLKWMWNQLKHSSQLPDPLQGFQQWEYLMRHHPGFWKRLIRRAGDHDSGQRRNLHIVTEFHGEFLKILQDHGHLFSTSQCGACMKEYHTFAKLKTHLLQVTACRQILQAQRLRWQPMPGAGSQINATMEAAHDGLLPPLKVQGPLLERPHGRADEDFDQDFLEKIFIDIVDAENIAECERLIRTAARETVLSWSTFQATLERFLELFTDADAAVLRVPGDELRHLLVTLRSPHAWTFLTSDGRAKTSPWHLEIAALEQHCLRLCLALARGFLRAISDVPINPEFQVSRHYSDIFGPLVCSAFGQTYGPDYAG